MFRTLYIIITRVTLDIYYYLLLFYIINTFYLSEASRSCMFYSLLHILNFTSSQTSANVLAAVVITTLAVSHIPVNSSALSASAVVTAVFRWPSCFVGEFVSARHGGTGRLRQAQTSLLPGNRRHPHMLFRRRSGQSEKRLAKVVARNASLPSESPGHRGRQ